MVQMLLISPVLLWKIWKINIYYIVKLTIIDWRFLLLIIHKYYNYVLFG